MLLNWSDRNVISGCFLMNHGIRPRNSPLPKTHGVGEARWPQVQVDAALAAGMFWRSACAHRGG